MCQVMAMHAGGVGETHRCWWSVEKGQKLYECVQILKKGFVGFFLSPIIPISSHFEGFS